MKRRMCSAWHDIGSISSRFQFHPSWFVDHCLDWQAHQEGSLSVWLAVRQRVYFFRWVALDGWDWPMRSFKGWSILKCSDVSWRFGGGEKGELTTAPKRVIQGLYSVVGGSGGGLAHCQPGDEVGPVVLCYPRKPWNSRISWPTLSSSRRGKVSRRTSRAALRRLTSTLSYRPAAKRGDSQRKPRPNDTCRHYILTIAYASIRPVAMSW